MKDKIVAVVFFFVFWLPTIVSALTVEEILLLKENGVSEKTIQMMIESENRATEYEKAENKTGMQSIVRPNGRSVILYSTGNDDRETVDSQERRKEKLAWEMLRHLIVDTRKGIK